MSKPVNHVEIFFASVKRWDNVIHVYQDTPWVEPKTITIVRSVQMDVILVASEIQLRNTCALVAYLIIFYKVAAAFLCLIAINGMQPILGARNA
jgi:hypothetical protein